ncbi:hypothetical protein V8V79_24130 [Bacillus nitratireducens]
MVLKFSQQNPYIQVSKLTALTSSITSKTLSKSVLPIGNFPSFQIK